MVFTREKREHWSFWNKFGLAFLFSYIIFYGITIFKGSLLKPIIYWVGKNILNISYEFSNMGYGSGDTTYAYIQVLVLLCIALLSAIIISLIARKKQTSETYNIAQWVLTIIVRFVLIYFLIVYGYSKVFYLQFSAPSLSRLLQPVGDMSPMGLAWTFMGYSKTYTIFSGLAEVIAGYLLISKRTQTLGAIFTVGVMGNVFMMNLCYDIPVKLFSLHLLLMGVFLLLTDFKRLLNILLFNKAVKRTQYFSPYLKDKDAVKAIRGLKLIFIVGLSALFISNSYSGQKKYGENREKPALYGIWEAQYFIKNKDTVVPLITDNSRWRYLIVDRKDRAKVNLINGTVERYTFKTDTLKQTITLHIEDSVLEEPNFTFKQPNKDHLELLGTHNTDSLHVIFKRKNLDDFLLRTRGFNWINERPHNK